MISARKPAPRHLLDVDVCVCACTLAHAGDLPVRHPSDETSQCSRVNEHLKPRARCGSNLSAYARIHESADFGFSKAPRAKAIPVVSRNRTVTLKIVSLCLQCARRFYSDEEFRISMN